LIVPAKDPGALAAAIAQLLQDDVQREALAGAGRQRIIERFSWQRAAQQMIDMYRRALP
jgi:glycosyltransferase involved in cell wall biosynthesis